MKTCSWGHPALTEKQVVAIVEDMIPHEIRPYYVGIDVMRQTLSEPITEWNTDIMVCFKAPVVNPAVDGVRYAHADLYNMQDEFDELYIDESTIGDEDFAEYDEEHEDEPIKEVMPLRRQITWHKRGYRGESF